MGLINHFILTESPYSKPPMELLTLGMYPAKGFLMYNINIANSRIQKVNIIILILIIWQIVENHTMRTKIFSIFD